MQDPPQPFDFVQPWDVEMFGADVADYDVRKRWQLAFAFAGGLPYIWNVIARPLTDVLYGLLEVRPGDRVLVIGEACEANGWGDGLRALVGPTGVVDNVEIILEGRKAVLAGVRGRNGRTGCWQWDYTKDMADESYDVVGVLQSTQHCDDWREQCPELLRVMKSGRRIVMAEATLGGERFRQRIEADVHMRQWFAKLFPPQMKYEEASQYSGEELFEMCSSFCEGPQFMEWHGIEMFWGRKP
jgi:hypothetical protein